MMSQKTELNKNVLPVQVHISVDEAQVHHNGHIQPQYDVRKSNMAAGKPEVHIT